MPSDKLKVAGGPSAKADPFDISNDHLYEHSREARFRIRQTFGAIEVFHAYPAKKLQIPFVSTFCKLGSQLLTNSTKPLLPKPRLEHGVGRLYSFLRVYPSRFTSSNRTHPPPSAQRRSKSQRIRARGSRRPRT